MFSCTRIELSNAEFQGNKAYKAMLKITDIIITKGILLLLSVTSSDILTFINIKINKKRIDTAPTYTKRYDNPIKFIPNIIRYEATLKNNPIKKSTETIGFLLVITNILHTIEVMVIIVKIS